MGAGATSGARDGAAGRDGASGAGSSAGSERSGSASRRRSRPERRSPTPATTAEIGRRAANARSEPRSMMDGPAAKDRIQGSRPLGRDSSGLTATAMVVGHSIHPGAAPGGASEGLSRRRAQRPFPRRPTAIQRTNRLPSGRWARQPGWDGRELRRWSIPRRRGTTRRHRSRTSRWAWWDGPIARRPSDACTHAPARATSGCRRHTWRRPGPTQRPTRRPGNRARRLPTAVRPRSSTACRAAVMPLARASSCRPP